MTLRVWSYLAPSIPQRFFAGVCDRLATTIGLEAALTVVAERSGPTVKDDPFASDDADVGFICTPSYLWLREVTPPSVELAGAAPVFHPERTKGRPVYWSDVIVRADHPARSFADLEQARWAYNDACSLSGYHALLIHLGDVDPRRFFSEIAASGSHLRSIDLVASGEVDGACIDSHALQIAFRREPELMAKLRVIDSWGPNPIQPVVVRASLDEAVKQGIRVALLEMPADEDLSPFGFAGFAPVSDADYAEVRRLLRGYESETSTGGVWSCGLE